MSRYTDSQSLTKSEATYYSRLNLQAIRVVFLSGVPSGNGTRKPHTLIQCCFYLHILAMTTSSRCYLGNINKMKVDNPST